MNTLRKLKLFEQMRFSSYLINSDPRSSPQFLELAGIFYVKLFIFVEGYDAKGSLTKLFREIDSLLLGFDCERDRIGELVRIRVRVSSP